ncbi:MAG: pyruvate, phosphate dikinase [Clostridiales bacterium]|jgi:pyruvate,orthophosphate dikinase|nr:pyruvate, phosphate dikinase [Clostridiales bacterium]
MGKYVYMFNEGNGKMRELVGGKGANLCEMTNLGLPIPQGFIVTTEACTLYNTSGRILSDELREQIDRAMAQLEKLTGKRFGDPENPLLVSVRSGSRASMPGMMDTVLNLGLNDVSVEAMAKNIDLRFAYDSYRRFIMMFSDVVMDVDKHDFEAAFSEYKESVGATQDLDLNGEQMKEVSEIFKNLYRESKGADFPADAKEQLYEAVCAVFRSWDNERAFIYRRRHDIPYSWGTAVNVQSMVFGNMGDDSGTGVAFSRNPATGENRVFGEFLMNAQGEDVVAGIRTPLSITKLSEENPEVYNEFVVLAKKLEKHYKDMQDMEFTVERGKLYFLQTRNGQRTAAAALRIAIEMVEEGLLSKEGALLQVDPAQLDHLLHPAFNPAALKKAEEVGRGLAASPGAASGRVYFTSQDAMDAAEREERVILVRNETSPEDIGGMQVARGILTAKGGATSHAAVVARGMGTPCICGCEELRLDFKNKEFTLGGQTFKEGDVISFDGSTGKIYAGLIPTTKTEISGDFATFMKWANEFKTLAIRTNADTPEDAARSLEFGAEGIGLIRSEHMFFGAERIVKMQKMILAETEIERIAACDELLPFQKADYIGIFKVMDGLPVTIRLLDPPLHEFVPKSAIEIKNLSKETGKSGDYIRSQCAALHEINPMMGHRGLRLAVSYPELAKMQTRAILEAAVEAQKSGIKVLPEIMIPLSVECKEFKFVKDIIETEAKEVEGAADVEYMIGTMIEIPRACLMAGSIAEEAEFFSFGTNDLTQMTYGLSRDDAGRILNDYIDNHIFETDPFARLDQKGVGELMRIAAERGRRARPALKLGICGEHGGDPASIEFCHKIGLDYVSCSPYRVPIARLAAAQAAIMHERGMDVENKG